MLQLIEKCRYLWINSATISVYLSFGFANAIIPKVIIVISYSYWKLSFNIRQIAATLVVIF